MLDEVTPEKPDVDDSLPRQAREDFDRYVEGWADIKKRADDCMKCLSKEGPWPVTEIEARSKPGEERPCIHEDVLTQYVNKVINQAEGSPVGIEVGPDGDGASDETARFEEDRIRQIDYESNAVHARLAGLESAVQQGIGIWEVGTDWEKPPQGDLKDLKDLSQLFRQKITTIAAQDPWSYVLDPDAIKPDWSDMGGAFKLRWFSHEEFKQKFPRAKIQDFKGLVSKENARWMDDNRVQVAEWWRVEKSYQKVLKIAGPDGTFKYEFAEQYSEEEIKSLDVLEERDVEICKVVKRLTNGVEILDEVPWPDYEVPILVCTGRVKYENGKRIIDSLIHAAIPGQLMYDYTVSGIVEETNRTIKAKAWGYEGAFDTTTPWATLNKDSVGYAEEKAVYDTKGNLLPRAMLIESTPQIAALLAQKQSILIGIQNAIGMTSTERVDRASKSGIAQQEIKEDMNINTYHFNNSWKMAIEREGRIKERLLATIEPKEGKASLRNAKGDHEMKDIPEGVYQGRHTVVISTGKAYKNQQEEIRDVAGQLTKSGDPMVQVASWPMLLRAMNLGPKMDALADELESVQPPQMQQARAAKSGKGPAPEQQIAQLQQQNQMLTEQSKQIMAAYKEASATLDAKVVENGAKKEIAESEARYDSLVKIAELRFKKYDADLKFRAEMIKLNAKFISEQESREHETMLAVESDAFDADMNQLQHGQAKELTGMGQEHEAAQADASRGHEAQMAAQAAEAAAATEGTETTA